MKCINHKALDGLQRSHPPRGGWIEMEIESVEELEHESHPPRGGWIEILYHPEDGPGNRVPPPTGWVD